MTRRQKEDLQQKLFYKNDEFIDSDDGRALRILAEYLGPLRTVRDQRVHDTIVFLGSARLEEHARFGQYYRDARELARMVTEWSASISDDGQRFLVCSGGGPGVMEAANRGAHDASGRTMGLNIGLPHAQRPNRFVTPELNFEFHYFFMRKLWFAHLAKAAVIFPGGFGTIDELFELLTLGQTGKLDRKIFIVLYGSSYWQEIVNFPALVRHGMISPEDLGLFHYADDPETALSLLKEALPVGTAAPAPAFAKSITVCSPGQTRPSSGLTESGTVGNCSVSPETEAP